MIFRFKPIPDEVRAMGLTTQHKRVAVPFRFEPPVIIGSGVALYPEVEIGMHSYANGGYICDRTRIGRFCSIAYYTTIGIGSHDIDFISTHPWTAKASHDPTFTRSNNWAAWTEVGHDVWVDQGATILKGVRIGTGAVIAAGAVVSSDVPPYAVVGGVPARIIKYRFDAQTIGRLLASEWWTLPLEFLLTLRPNNISECLDHIEAADVARVSPCFVEL